MAKRIKTTRYFEILKSLIIFEIAFMNVKFKLVLPKTHLFPYSFAAFIVTLLLISCSQEPGVETAGRVRELALKELKNDTSANVREACASIDSCTLRTNEDCKKMYRKVDRITYTIHHSGNVTKSMRIHHGILDILEKANTLNDADTRELLNMYVRLGAAAEEDGMPGASLEYYTKGLRISRDTIYSPYRAILYNNIGVLYAQIDRYDKAAEFFKMALDINLKEKIHHETALNYSNLAELYFKTGDIDKAMEATQNSLDHIDGKRHPGLLAGMRVQQGNIYVLRQQYDVALSRFSDALKLYRNIDYMPGVIDSYICLANTYLQRNKPDSAMRYAVKALNTARHSTQNEYVSYALKLLSRVQVIQGNHPDAVCSLNEAISLDDSLRKVENRLRLNNWEVSSVMRKAEDENADKATLFHPLLCAASILLAVCIWLAIHTIRTYRRQPSRQSKGSEQTRAMSMEIDKLHRELTTLSLDKIRMEDSLQRICDELREVIIGFNPRETAKRNLLRDMLRQLDSLGNAKADEEFKLYFGRMHPEFYHALNEKYPDLTSKDTRLCAFLYLGLTTKEIADITSREVRSVESARNRLRKKMSLDISTDLTAHLRSLPGTGHIEIVE